VALAMPVKSIYMKTLFTTFLLLFYSYAWSQLNRQSVINTSGGTFQQGYFQFEWNVGEAALVDHMQDDQGKISVSNGFLQPYLLFPGNKYPSGNFDPMEVRIFPNPATEYVELNISTPQVGQLVIYFYTATGQRIFSRQLAANGVDLIERIDVTSLPQGNYFLHLELLAAKGSLPKKSIYKIVKTQ
jgi:hypothetical protein